MGCALPRAGGRATGHVSGQARPVRAILPPSPPDQPEPFARSCATSTKDPPGHHPLEPPALLRLIGGHRLRAGDPRRAPRRRPELIAILWRSSPAATEVETHAVDWVPQLLGLQTDSTATSRTRRRPRPSLRWPPPAIAPGGTVFVRTGELLGGEGGSSRRPAHRQVPMDEDFRRPEAVADELDGAAAVVATSGTTSAQPSTRSCDRGPLRASGCLAPRRRGLCRLGRRVRGVPLVPGGRGAR